MTAKLPSQLIDGSECESNQTHQSENPGHMAPIRKIRRRAAAASRDWTDLGAAPRRCWCVHPQLATIYIRPHFSDTSHHVLEMNRTPRMGSDDICEAAVFDRHAKKRDEEYKCACCKQMAGKLRRSAHLTRLLLARGPLAVRARIAPSDG